MKLIKILDIVNQIEKSSFLKIIDNLSSELRTSDKEIDKILSECEGQIKNIDNVNIVKLFNLVKPQFKNLLDNKLQFNDFQLDILIDIMIRDGNSIMSRNWFNRLYSNEISNLKKHLKTFLPLLDEDNQEISPQRKRDYIIYKNCVKTAYENDELINREKIITKD